jgi:hypothetical protein
VPALAFSRHKPRAAALANAHRALALAALGDVQGARAAIADAWRAQAGASQATSPLGALDDSLGVLAGLEHHRDARAVILLADALAAVRAGEASRAIDLVGTQGNAFAGSWLPRERMLAAGLDARARQSMQGLRSPAAAAEAPGEDAWVQATLGRA